MNKTFFILIFSVVLIYYGVNKYFFPNINDGQGDAASSPLIQAEPAAGISEAETVVDDTTDDKAANGHTAGHTTSTINQPLEPEIRDAVRELVNTSHEGLVKEKTDNGVMVDLKGRFRTAPVATIGKDGELTIRDYTAPPPQ